MPVIYGIQQIAQDGLAWPAGLPIGAGLACGVAFIRRQLRLADPLLDVRLFRQPAFSAALAINALGFFVLMGVFSFLAQCLQLVLGLPPVQAGLWTVPAFGGFILGSMITPAIVRWIRPAPAMAAGLVLAATGFWVLTRVGGAPGITTVVAGSVVSSAGLAPVFTLVTAVVVSSAPPQRAGAASAMAETSTELGGALGIAILGSIGTAVYRRVVDGTIPAGVPGQAARATRDTLAGAAPAAAHLPGQLATGLLRAARTAFTGGLDTVAAISAGTMVVLAVVAAVLLRGTHPGADGTATPMPPNHRPASRLAHQRQWPSNSLTGESRQVSEPP